MGELARREASPPAVEAQAIRTARPAQERPLSPGAWPGAFTGILLGNGRVTACTGCFHRGHFHVLRMQDAETPRTGADGPRTRMGKCGCALVPSRSIVSKVLRLPAGHADELASMARHQLALDLPVDPVKLSWAVSPIGREPDGRTKVLVEVARTDHLEEAIRESRPYLRDVAAAVSEGRAYALAAFHVHGDPSNDRATLAWNRDHFHLVVERAGTLVFHRTFAATPPEGPRPDQPLTHALLAAATELPNAMQEFTSLHRTAFPARIHLIGGPTPVAGFEVLIRDLATRLAARLTTDVEVADKPTQLTDRAIARAAAELGTRGEGNLLLGRDDVRRPRVRRVAMRLLIAVFVATAVTALFLAGNLQRQQRRLDALLAQAELERTEVTELLRMQADIAAARAADANDGGLARLLASLTQSLPEGVYLEKFAYGSAQGVRLQGTATDGSVVVEMADRMSALPEWADVRVLRVQRRDERSPYRFEIEAHPASARANPGGTR